MTDQPTRDPGAVPRPLHDLVVQLHGLTEKLAGVTGLSGLVGSLPGSPGLSSLPSMPRPGSLSAAQLRAVASAVSAQRRSVEALQTQLAAFGDQLAVMEQILQPVLEWTTTWADLEATLMGSPPTPDE